MKKNILLLVLTVLLLFQASLVFADTPLKIPQQPPFGTDLPTYLKWVFDFGVAIGFASIIIAFVVSGIFFILSYISPGSIDAAGRAKEWFQGALTGLIIFVLFYLIVTTLNPDLAIFRIGKPLSTPEGNPAPAVTNPGLYFYEKENCQGDALGYLDQPSDIFKQTKKINSVRLVSNSFFNVFQDHYFAVIYGDHYFQDKCQVYFTPNCYNVKINDIESVMVKKYNTLGGFGDLTFYRYPSFNDKGGSYKLTMLPGLSAPWAAGKTLKDLTFSQNGECSVPPKEQNCTQFNSQGVCVARQCPNLEGNNIASMQMNGNFLALLSYRSSTDDADVDTFCQTYPAFDDINKTGPKQIKWDAINNNYTVNKNTGTVYYPNYIRVIFTNN